MVCDSEFMEACRPTNSLKAPGMCGAWALSPDDGKFYGMVVAAIPGLGVTCIMPAETILSGVQKRWQDARQELFDLLPIEAISAEEMLAASISKSYVPDPKYSLLTGTGRERFQDDRGVSAELVLYHENPNDPQKLISELTTERQVLQEKLNTVNEEVRLLGKQLRTAINLHNTAKQAATRLQQDKKNLEHNLKLSTSRLESSRAKYRDLETDILENQASAPLTARESGLFGPSSSASTELINPRSKPSHEANRDFWIPDDGIERDVITNEVTRFLGGDALVEPGKNDVRLQT